MVISVDGTITNFFRSLQMISVGIDVSKEKSTICILKLYGEIVSKPFEVCHTEKELSELTSMLLRLNDDVRVVIFIFVFQIMQKL